MNRTYKCSRRNPLRRLLASAAFFALLVTILPVGATWGWFSDRASGSIPAITSAHYDADITVTSEDDPETPIAPGEDGLYSLVPGNYTVTLSRSGDSTASTGYCTVRSASGLNSHTQPLTDSMTFYLVVDPVDSENPEKADQIEILPYWGTYQGNGIMLMSLTEEVCIEDGLILNTWGEILDELPAPAPTYEALFEHAIPLYYQNDYPNNRYGSGTIASDGCGVVSLAMLADYMTGYSYSIPDLARWFGGTAENNIERFENGATTLGLPWEKAENIDKAIESLYEGKIVVMMMDGFEAKNPFTTTQHFVVVRGVTTEDRFLVHDPNRRNYDNWELQTGFQNGFTRDTLVSGYSGAWVFDPSAMPEDFVPYVKEEPPRQDNYPGIELTYEEQELIARVIWVEAQGECDEGQQAVAEVILNRLVSGKFGSTVSSIIYAEGQFRSVPYLEDATPWQAQFDALDAARYGIPVLEQDVYYFAREAMTSQVFATIGGHVFCKGEPEPVETEPVETEPVETEPVETEPVETEPVETEPVETEPVETEPVETEPVETEPVETEPVETEPPATEPEEQPEGVPVFYQADYPDIPWGEGTIEDSGSSIISLTMAAGYLTGYDYTPDILAEWFDGIEGDDIARLDEAIATLMLPGGRSENLEAAAAAAADQKLLILRLESTEETPSLFTDGVHYLVVCGITEEGGYLVYDPSGEQEELPEGFEHAFALEEIMAACTNAWVFDKDALPDDFVPYTQ